MYRVRVRVPVRVWVVVKRSTPRVNVPSADWNGLEGTNERFRVRIKVRVKVQVKVRVSVTVKVKARVRLILGFDLHCIGFINDSFDALIDIEEPIMNANPNPDPYPSPHGI